MRKKVVMLMGDGMESEVLCLNNQALERAKAEALNSGCRFKVKPAKPGNGHNGNGNRNGCKRRTRRPVRAAIRR